MTMRRFYLAMENLALTAPQQQQLVDALKVLGPVNDANPAKRPHWRVRTDGLAVLMEAEFNDDNFTAAAVRQYLATIFGVPVAQVTSTTSNPASGTLLTLSYQSVQRLRCLIFGGASATYDQSKAAAQAYLAVNSAMWGEG
jgi:hypothetical protein